MNAEPSKLTYAELEDRLDRMARRFIARAHSDQVALDKALADGWDQGWRAALGKSPNGAPNPYRREVQS